MPLLWLDHINIRTSNVVALANFYHRVLGLESSPRPPFSFGGRWLYWGDKAWVHLVETAEQPRVDEIRIEHFAIRAQGLDEFLAHLKSLDPPYRLSDVPDYHIRQVNVYDPDGNRIEIQFDMTAEPGSP
ncbi:MAG: VOC family protein [Gammaproteobacteria bacterium]|nr:VOC family protein [Gammaproteobacteria bacterium]